MNLLINFFATYLIFLLPAIGLYFFFIKNDYPLVFKMTLAALVWRATDIIIKSVLFVPRPYMINHLPTYVTTAPIDSSFPSTHTMLAAAISTVIYKRHPKLGLFLFLISLLIGLGRIMANVHYPRDIFGGLILGVIIGLFCDKILSCQTLSSRFPHLRKKKKKKN